MKDRRLKILLPALLGLVLIFSSLTNLVFALDLPDPSQNFFYLDQMGVLSDQTKDQIMKTNIEIEKKTKAQVVVATINDLQEYPIEDYALELFRKWKIGDKDLNNGVLILLGKEPTIDKYSIFIATGYGLEGILNDGKVGRILDNYFIPLVDRDDLSTFDTALSETFKAVISQLLIEYEVDLDGNYQAYMNKLSTENPEDDWALTLFILIVVIIIYLALRKNPRGPGGWTRSGPTYRSSRSYRSGGFTGGKSSRGGFGGGGFSGGGGSTGGGGAGRSF